jgi:hypothetical protein
VLNEREKRVGSRLENKETSAAILSSPLGIYRKNCTSAILISFSNSICKGMSNKIR